MTDETGQLPSWWDKTRLVFIRYEIHEKGWAIDCGDGTYRLVNNPIRGSVGCYDATRPQLWDLVTLVPDNGTDSWLAIVEKYVHPSDDADGSAE